MVQRISTQIDFIKKRSKYNAYFFVIFGFAKSFKYKTNFPLSQMPKSVVVAYIRRFYCRFRVSTSLIETFLSFTIMATFFLFRKPFWLSVIRFPFSIFLLDFQGWCLIGIILCSSIHIHHDRDFWFQIWGYILLKLAQ